MRLQRLQRLFRIRRRYRQFDIGTLLRLDDCLLWEMAGGFSVLITCQQPRMYIRVPARSINGIPVPDGRTAAILPGSLCENVTLSPAAPAPADPRSLDGDDDIAMEAGCKPGLRIHPILNVIRLGLIDGQIPAKWSAKEFDACQH